jgi:hypothetical protein
MIIYIGTATDLFDKISLNVLKQRVVLRFIHNQIYTEFWKLMDGQLVRNCPHAAWNDTLIGNSIRPLPKL